ncbi:ABC transporter ATP-binding protein [Halobacillus shinanisalinarum]|uniref:ABC transporter ATP-binding protein n=1 Tax=Halobacillus shinanisalinarum TaxID=2932258 RepID=A0ABY4GYZ6_9BACI|nr:ABC transporter ATP-binding protein [Halobacillus shinanisalinarum]UOQ92627.1 ABC transporter ATP-binding protein [Halobacillus shinanisalinarum]
MSVLIAKQVTKTYGGKQGIKHTAIDHLDLKIRKGEFLGVMGPSGSGKTTLLNLLSSIDKPTSGTIEVNGKRISTLSTNQLAKFRRREMGFVFQDFNLLDTLTIGENIVLPLTLAGMSVKEMEKKLAAVTKRLGIDTILRNRTYEVSGGQKQRASMARAIIHDPAVVFADEPTGNLDSKSSKQAMESLASLHEKDESTIMMVSHDAYAASFCERIVFIKDGKLFTEIHRGDNRQSFFQDILNVQSLLGGNTDDLQTVRV